MSASWSRNTHCEGSSWQHQLHGIIAIHGPEAKMETETKKISGWYDGIVDCHES